MLQTESSPLADLATTSFAVLPSEPGAPFGHKGISVGSSAASNMTAVKSEKTSVVNIFIDSGGIRFTVSRDYSLSRSDSNAKQQRHQGAKNFCLLYPATQD